MREERNRIMIVGEDLLFTELVMENLSGEFDIRIVGDGETALAVARDYNPHVILIDRTLPDLAGDEICRRLKGDRLTMTIPVIMITAVEGKDEMVPGLEAGADDYIAKPVYLPELLTKIRLRLRTRDLYSAFEREDLLNVLEIYETVTRLHGSHEILAGITRKMADFVNAVRCSVVKVEENRCAYVLASSEGDKIRDLRIDLDNYPEIRKAMEMNKEVIIDDLTRDPIMERVRKKVRDLPFRSLALLPISIRDRYTGTLLLIIATKKGLTEKDLKLCEVVARMAASVLENAALLESLRLANIELEKLATTDGLTGIYNHRYFYNRLDEEFNIAVRYNVPLACIMLDIDYFKDINDTYGHREGDKILRELAMVMKRTVRSTDVVARYGGEEFAILLPHTDEKGAMFQAERMRRAVKGYRFPGLPEDKRLTISLGIATCRNEKVRRAEDLVKFADKALYLAKQKGRDTSVLYRPES